MPWRTVINIWWLKQAGFRGAKTPEFARRLMERGLDPSRANWLGVSPLHRFAMSGDRDMAAVCLGFGADINPIGRRAFLHTAGLGRALRPEGDGRVVIGTRREPRSAAG